MVEADTYGGLPITATGQVSATEIEVGDHARLQLRHVGDIEAPTIPGNHNKVIVRKIQGDLFEPAANTAHDDVEDA